MAEMLATAYVGRQDQDKPKPVRRAKRRDRGLAPAELLAACLVDSHMEPDVMLANMVALACQRPSGGS